MATSSRKTIAVIGATGQQGSSVANTFLKLPIWKVRAITRNPSSATARDLASRGAEVVHGDLADIESLSKAFQGAHAIFVNTDFWTTYRPLMAEVAAGTKILKTGEPEPSRIAFDTEVAHGKNAAQAAAQIPTLERFIYSALPHLQKLSGGKYKGSYHWDSKGTIVDYIEEELPGLAKKSSFLYLGAYNTNALLSPKLDPSDGKYKFTLPMTPNSRMPIINQNASTGLFVQALIENEKPGVKLLAYDKDSYLTIQQLVDVWSKASGKEASLVTVSIDYMHEKFGLPMEILEAPAFIVESGYAGSMAITEPHQLSVPVQTQSFEEWLEKRDWKTLLAADELPFQKAHQELGNAK